MFEDARKIRRSMLGNPDEWRCLSHTYEHTPTGYEVWIANGFWFLGRFSPNVQYNLIEKIIVYTGVFKLRGKERAERKNLKEFNG